MHTLKAFLEDKARGEFAKEIGISAPYLSQLANGTRTPSLRVAKKIEDATAGSVPVSAWASSACGSAA